MYIIEMEREEGVVVMGRAEIDTRAPFRSVKEAVMLFGERVLVGEIYANKLKEMQMKASENGEYQSRIGAVTTELEETKQSLKKAREEGNFMAYCLKSLKEELERTKRELQVLKAREYSQKQPIEDPEIEELKFIENPITKFEGEFEFQKKRSVKFASPPSLTRIITSKELTGGELPEKPCTSLKKKSKWKSLIPLIGGLFWKKKGNQEEGHDQTLLNHITTS